LAEELNLQQVTFRGYVSEQEKHQLLQDAYSYVLPTRLEGLGLSNLEAMASGCAVISTYALGVRDYLENEENGLAVPAEESQALADAIQRLNGDPELGERLAKAGRQTVEQDFGIEDAVEREREVLERFAAEIQN
jgi:glycosyltransferase involved in cell wall biosynthesis